MQPVLQVCTSAQAIKFKQLGVDQSSFFTWYGCFPGSDVEPNVDLTDQVMYEFGVNGYYGHPDRMYSAFTLAEIGAMIGRGTRLAQAHWHWLQGMVNSGFSGTVAYNVIAVAGFLITALEEGVETVEEVNQRLQSA